MITSHQSWETVQVLLMISSGINKKDSGQVSLTKQAKLSFACMTKLVLNPGEFQGWPPFVFYFNTCYSLRQVVQFLFQRDYCPQICSNGNSVSHNNIHPTLLSLVNACLVVCTLNSGKVRTPGLLCSSLYPQCPVQSLVCSRQAIFVE